MRDDDGDLEPRRVKKQSGVPLLAILLIVGGVFLVGLAAVGTVAGWFLFQRPAPAVKPQDSLPKPDDQKDAGKAKVTIVDEKPALSTHVNGIVNDYRNNAIGADAKYKGKYVELSGEVQEVKVDASGRNFVGMRTIAESQFQDFPSNVICYVRAEVQSAFGNLKEGDKVKLVGKVTGHKAAPIQFGFIIILEDARLAK